MKAMILPGIVSMAEGKPPLILTDTPVPDPKPSELLIKVGACGVCHTELDEIEGRTPPARFPIIPGHQVVGRVAACGHKVASGHLVAGSQQVMADSL